jgi:hypothetical protein
MHAAEATGVIDTVSMPLMSLQLGKIPMSERKKITLDRTTIKLLQTRTAIQTGQSPLPSQGSPAFCVKPISGLPCRGPSIQ